MKIKIGIVLLSAAACLLTACTSSPETSQSTTTAVITETPTMTQALTPEPTAEVTQAPVITEPPTEIPTDKPETKSEPKNTEKPEITVKPAETRKSKSETKTKISTTKKKETAKSKETTVKKKSDKKKETTKTTTKTKSAYDYPFDVGRIKNDMIAKGESMGMKHVTSFAGEAYTPENSSWGVTITADKELQGVKLKNKLMEYVGMYTPKFFEDHDGEPAKEFTIYAESIGGGSYQFYFLY